MFGFYSLKFGSVWILHPKISKFGGIKSKYLETLWGKIQIMKHQDVKIKHPKTLENKFQILKFHGVKFERPKC